MNIHIHIVELREEKEGREHTALGQVSREPSRIQTDAYGCDKKSGPNNSS